MARWNMRNFAFLRTCAIVHIHISIIQIISIPSIFTLIHRLIVCDCLDIRIQYYSNFIINLIKISMFIDLSLQVTVKYRIVLKNVELLAAVYHC